MDYIVGDVFTEMKTDIKLESTNFEDMVMPDFIDIREGSVVRAIKQEELIIQVKSEDCNEDNR